MNFDSSEYISILLDNFVKKYPQYSYSKLTNIEVNDKMFSIMNKTGNKTNKIKKTVSWDTKLYVIYNYQH